MFKQDLFQKCKGSLPLDESINQIQAHQCIKEKARKTQNTTELSSYIKNLSQKSKEQRTLDAL